MLYFLRALGGRHDYSATHRQCLVQGHRNEPVYNVLCVRRHDALHDVQQDSLNNDNKDLYANS